MTPQLKDIIDKLDRYIQKANQTGNKYDFIDPAYDVLDELETMPGNFSAVQPILELIERSPHIDYGGPGPLGSFLESHYNKGYEDLLIQSIRRNPSEYTLHLLHRLINDPNDNKHDTYLELMRGIAENGSYPEPLRNKAKESLTYLQK